MVGRRELLTRIVPIGALGLVAAACGQTLGAAPGAGAGSLPLALIYRGPAGCPGCSEAVRTMLRSGPSPFRTEYCGPDEATPISASTLASAALYVQPGGGDDLKAAWTAMRPYADVLRRWVRHGGHYLGICMGGFLAGFDPGFGFLPGDSGEYTRTPNATVTTDGDALVSVRWRGQDRSVYFQGGPSFSLRPQSGATVLATYTNGRAAALVAPFGAGTVGVVGPHPEAPASWYREAGLKNPGGAPYDLGHDLVRATLGRRRQN